MNLTDKIFITLAQIALWAVFVRGVLAFSGFDGGSERSPLDLCVITIVIGMALVNVKSLRFIDKLIEDSIKRNIDKSSNFAYVDELTDLPNRRFFNELLATAVEESCGGNAKLCLMILDLDDFKNINDAFGHHVGDMVIKEVSKRITHEVDDFSQNSNSAIGKCIVSRIAGDEFAILLRGVESKVMLGSLADRILSIISEKNIIDGKLIRTTASIGISQFPSDAKNHEDLFKNSDMSMYESKRNGKARYSYFDCYINEIAMNKIQLERDICVAINEDQFDLVYQPKVNINTGRINNFEALIRWNHPRRGLVCPNDFIPFAEESGSIKKIGMWVFNTLCRHIKFMEESPRWDGGFVVSFNVSAQQIQDDNFIRFLKNSLKAYNVNPKHLEMEITEHSLLKNLDRAIVTITEIREMGISVSLDDFGTGYSSLSYLERLPIDTLKIDKSFVVKSIIYRSNKAIIKSIVTLAKGLDLNVVAEGVETLEQLCLVRELGCDFAQGYYFFKPMSFYEINKIELQLNEYQIGKKRDVDG
jgi:diguanylate cyclase (GGDEF)-like protein